MFSQKMKKGNFFLYLLGFIASVFSIFFISQTNFFKIKEIKCFVEKEICPENLKKQVRELEGQSLFFTNLELKISQVLGEESVYTVDSISKEIPSKITVEFKKQKQLYLIKLDQKLFLVNQDASISQIIDPSDKKLIELNITLQEEVLQTKKVPLEIHQKILALLNSIDEEKLEISNVRVSKELFLLEIRDNKQVLIKENPAQAIKKLALILEKFDFEGHEGKITEIDLRFKLPVLRAKKTEF